MCGCAAFKTYSADLNAGGALKFWLCVCLEFNMSTYTSWRSFVFVPCFMFSVEEFVQVAWKEPFAKMLCICYNQGSIVLAVCATSFWFYPTRFSLIFPRSPLCFYCVVCPRPIEIINHIEIGRLICCWLLNMSTLVINYINDEENTVGHVTPIFSP